jgi:hypothetical protein
MTADLSRKANPAPGKVQPGSGPPASDDADGRDDDAFKSTIAELQRRLAERAARLQAVDPAAAKMARRAALEAYDRTRARRQRLILGLAGGAIACSSIIYLVAAAGSKVAPSPSATLPEPAPLLSMAVAAPISALPDPASPSPATMAVSGDNRCLYTRRRTCGPASGASGGQPTGTCRDGVERGPTATRRSEGNPGATAILWL